MRRHQDEDAGKMILAEIKKLAKKMDSLEAKLDDVKNQLTQSRPDTRWWIGDNTSTDELIARVRECIADRPRTLKELIELTGARESRVSGAIVQLQVKREPVVNLGTKYRALWWMNPKKPTESEDH